MSGFYVSYTAKRPAQWHHKIQVRGYLQKELSTPQHLTYVNRYNACLNQLQDHFKDARLQPICMDQYYNREPPIGFQQSVHNMLRAALRTPEDCCKFREICGGPLFAPFRQKRPSAATLRPAQAAAAAAVRAAAVRAPAQPALHQQQTSVGSAHGADSGCSSAAAPGGRQRMAQQQQQQQGRLCGAGGDSQSPAVLGGVQGGIKRQRDSEPQLLLEEELERVQAQCTRMGAELATLKAKVARFEAVQR